MCSGMRGDPRGPRRDLQKDLRWELVGHAAGRPEGSAVGFRWDPQRAAEGHEAVRVS